MTNSKRRVIITTIVIYLSVLVLLTRGWDESTYDSPSRHRRQADPSLRKAWVTQDGYHVTEPVNETSIEVAATPSVDPDVLDRATRLVYLLVRFMSNNTFQLIANNVSIGILNENEFPSVFPEYRPDNMECRYRCPDYCSAYCDNGVPIGIMWSYPGRRLVIPAGNILCGQGQFDPEFAEINLLVHEFAETLVKYVLPSNVVDEIIAAYNASKATWNLKPSNHVNYFRQGTAAWFRATTKSDTGGMTTCSSGEPCTTEESVRLNLQQRDIQLFNILTSIYNYDQWNLSSNISVCTW